MKKALTRRVISLFLCLCIVIGFVPIIDAQAAEIKGGTFDLSNVWSRRNAVLNDDVKSKAKVFILCTKPKQVVTKEYFQRVRCPLIPLYLFFQDIGLSSVFI